ncbi:stage 0 sporulation protein [Patescibacteria group bacterium]|nr:stage 0 sporulation protein [Patescibacteria group bacterium]
MNLTFINSLFDAKILEIAYKDVYDEYKRDEEIVFSDNDNKEFFGTISAVKRVEANPKAFRDDIVILRRATANDRQKIEANAKREKDAYKLCCEKIAEHKLEMRLTRVIYSLDGSLINFIFTADDRVDFRELVKDLAKTFQKQIHLQQIGPRDKAKLMSGIGKCGQNQCCGSYLNNLASINMDMVRTQGMANKGSSKLSGNCGKLMCCLAYEVDEYKKLASEMPGIGSIVKFGSDEGEVIDVDVMNKQLKVKTDSAYLTIPVGDVKKVLKKNVNEQTPQPIS